MVLIETETGYCFEQFVQFGVFAGFSKKYFDSLDSSKDASSFLHSFNHFPSHIISLDQIHSSQVAVIKEIPVSTLQGDGLVSGLSNMALMVRTADCLPVFLYDTKKKVMGLIHMGWRSAREGILEVGIKTLQKTFFLDMQDCIVGLGPGLRKCCYQVGEEFQDMNAFKGFLIQKNNAWFLDIVRYTITQLKTMGIQSAGIADSRICSKCMHETVYSYRKEQTSRRTLSLIMRIR